MPGKLKYDTYHKEFTGAIQHAYAVVKKQGYKLDKDSQWNDVTTGPKKPGKGKTNEYHLKLKGTKKGLHIQVYNTGPKYELNMYIEETDMTDLDKFITLLEAYDYYVHETTIHISNELFNEAVKAGKGSIKNVDINLDASDYDGGEKQYIKDVKKRFKVTIKLHRNGAYLTGKKADIIQFLLSDMYGGVGEDDIEDMWPELMEAFSFFKKKKKPGKVNVKPGRGNAKMDIDKDAMDNVKKGADKKHGITMRPRGDEVILSGPKDKLLSFVTQELGWDKDDVKSMWPDLLESQPDDQSDEDVPDDRGNYHGVEEAHNGHTDDESPKKKVDDDEGNYSGVEEEAPSNSDLSLSTGIFESLNEGQSFLFYTKGCARSLPYVFGKNPTIIINKDTTVLDFNKATEEYINNIELKVIEGLSITDTERAFLGL